MTKNHYLGIDTSVLDRIQKFEHYAQIFESFTLKNNLTVLIPNGTTVEFFGRSVTEESKKSAKWFLEFLKSSNLKLVLGKDWKFLIRKEMKCFFENPPVLSETEKRKLFDVLENPIPRQDLIDDFQKRKKDLYKKDSTLVSLINGKTPNENAGGVNQVQERFENYTGPYENNLILFMINKKFGLKPKDVLIFSSRYKIAYINAMLTEYYQLGLMVDKETKLKSSNPIYEKSGKQKNTHDDNKIVAECAYCDYFLTEDETLYKRCHELFQKKLLTIEPLKPLGTQN